jgi:hypothetical protein
MINTRFHSKVDAFSVSHHFIWRCSQFYWRISIFIGEKINLLAISAYLLAKINFYWRTGNSQRFFPVEATQKYRKNRSISTIKRFFSLYLLHTREPEA